MGTWVAVELVCLLLGNLVELVCLRRLAITLIALGPPTVPAEKTLLPKIHDGPVDLVRTQLAAYEAAGFTDAQSKELVQESLRTAVKQAGGWLA